MLNAPFDLFPLARPGVLMVTLAALAIPVSAQAQDMDYGGADVVILEDTTWSGRHTNIGTLIVNSNVTLQAAIEQRLFIQANRIEVRGTISADEAGFAGGEPGGQGRAGTGGQGLANTAGGAGNDGAVCGRPGIDYNAGGGGGGGGSLVGAGGGGGYGADANDGGCQGAAGGSGGQPVTLEDDRAYFGAGGGGGGGAGGPRHNTGSAGRRGGGILELEARTINVIGRISANGGTGGTGGTSPDFFHGGGGGGGASGGTVIVRTTHLIGGDNGRIEARGGDGGNGGRGDVIGDDRFNGASGGGGGGGLVRIFYAASEDVDPMSPPVACNVMGGDPGGEEGTNVNTNQPNPSAAGGLGLCDWERVNGPPTADPGGQIPPYFTTEGRPLTVDGSGSSDPENGELIYAWDCDNNGSTDATGVTATCDYDADGEYTIALTVTDDQGATDTATTRVIVNDAPPTAVLTGPALANEGASVTFDASGSDGGTDGIATYAWDFDYDGEQFEADMTTQDPTASHTYCDNAPNGSYTVVVRVTDEDGSSALASHQLRINNLPPSVTSSPVTEGVEGMPYSYTLTVEDPGCDEFSYTFRARPEGMEVSDSGEVNFTPNFRNAAEGCQMVDLVVFDDDNGNVSHTWELCISFADSDEDGLPDTWESFYQLDPNNNADAMEDPDSDGRNNTVEFNADTNPREFDGPSQARLARPLDDGEVPSVTPELAVFRAVSPLRLPLEYDVELYSFVESPAMLMPDLLLSEAQGLTIPMGASELVWTVPDTAMLEDHTSYCWRARAFDGTVSGPWSELRCFFVNIENEAPNPPTVLNPLNNEVLDIGTPDLIIGNCTDPDRDPVTYTFVLYEGESQATPLDSLTNVPGGEMGMTTWSVEDELTENETYCWRAQCRDNEGRASDFTPLSCFRINRQNELPDTPVITDPIADAMGNTPNITETPVTIFIRNSEDPEDDALIYTFELDTVVTFDSPDYTSAEVPQQADGETAWTPEEGSVEWKDNTSYFVRVKASDGFGSSGFATTEFFLNFANDPPTAPEVVTPINNTIVFTRSPTLTVRNALDNDNDDLTYQFEVYDDPMLENRSAIISGVSETPEVTRFKPTSTQLVNGSYYWRARADDGQSSGPWSDVGAFIVQIEVTEDYCAQAPDDPLCFEGSTGDPDAGGGGTDTGDGDGDGGGAGDDGCGCTQLPAKRPSRLPLTLALLSVLGGLILVRRR